MIESLSHLTSLSALSSFPKHTFNHLQSIDVNITSFSGKELVDLLYGSLKFNSCQNDKTVHSSFSIVVKSERSNGLLL